MNDSTSGPRDQARERERALSAAGALDWGCSRDEWIRISMAAKASGLTFEEWHSLCATAANYKNEADCRAVWTSMKGEGISAASLFAAALSAGWKDHVESGKRPSVLKSAPAAQPQRDAPPRDPFSLWSRYTPAPPDHGYLVSKGMAPDGLRIATGRLEIAGNDVRGWIAFPVWNIESGALQSIQFAASDAGVPKLSLPRCRISGGAMTIHPDAPEGRMSAAAMAGSVVFVAEGAATAASCYQATGKAAVATFGKSNVATIAQAIRAKYPGVRIVLVPDRGAESQAEKIAATVGGPVGWVALPEDRPANYDANDYAADAGLEALAELLVDVKEPPPPAQWPLGMSGAVAEYLSSPPPAEHWFAFQRLLADRAHLLSGIGGSSKTRCLYHLAIGGTIGRVPWGWKIDRVGSAALFLAEDAPANVHRTLAAIVKHSDFTEEEVEKITARLFVFPLAGKDARLLAAVAGSLIETEAAAGLFRRCKSISDLRFIGLDPALGLTEGDEMNPAHQRRLGELVDRLALETGSCVVLASHAAKALQNADEVGSHSSRGSGAITDAVRGEFTLRTMTPTEGRQFGIADIEERKSHVQLTATKGNELPPEAFAPLWLKRGPGGVLQLADLTRPEADPIGQRERAAFDLLKNLAVTTTPQLMDWRDACATAGLLSGETQDARKKCMDRVRDTLLAAGMIERGVGRGVFLPKVMA